MSVFLRKASKTLLASYVPLTHSFIPLLLTFILYILLFYIFISIWIQQNAVQESKALTKKNVSQLVDLHKKGEFRLSNWTTHAANPKPWVLGEEKTLAWIFVVDTLNFCFWHPTSDAYFAVDFEGTHHRGYMSLCACINRAMAVRNTLASPPLKAAFHGFSNFSLTFTSNAFSSLASHL